MAELAWQTTDLPTSSRMAKARRQAHNGVHWLARLANSYIEPEPDGRHVDLFWNDEHMSIQTKTFQSELAVELRIADLDMQFCESGQPVPHILSFQERTPAHIEAWVLVELLHRGVDRELFSKELPYLGRDLMLGDSEDHEVDAYRVELSSLNGWFCNAAAVCTALRQELGSEVDHDQSSMPVICWPETFQLGIEVPLPQGFGARALRAGLSAGDALRPEPFFFTSTIEQAISGDFDAANVLPIQRIPADNLTALDVIERMRTAIVDQRKRLAG